MADPAALLPTYAEPFIRSSLGISEFDCIPLAGDASSRRYFRIVVGERASVLMVWEPFDDPNSFAFLNVQRHFSKHGVHVPQVLGWSAPDGLVLLEDLGDLTLERKFWENQDQDLAMPYYEMAIDELIKIHFACTDDNDKSCTAFKIQFDTAKLLWEMNYGREHVLEKLCGLNLSEATWSGLALEFKSICERLDLEPKRIAHRDYHSRNLMLKFGKVRVIDFQDARLGTVQYDLVSLLYDSYVQLSPNHRNLLLNSYWQKAKDHHKGDWSREHFDEIMRVQILQRCFKACGSFASFFNLRNDRRYLKYLGGTLRIVDETLRDFCEFPVFQAVIRDYGLLDRKFDPS